MQISLVFQKSAFIVNFLREKHLSTRHSLSLVSMTLPSYVRFPSGVISWTGSSLLKLDRLWMQAYKMACGVSRSTASCIMRFPSALGGRNLPTPLAVISETVWSHLESCCFDAGGLRELLGGPFKTSREAAGRPRGHIWCRLCVFGAGSAWARTSRASSCPSQLSSGYRTSRASVPC